MARSIEEVRQMLKEEAEEKAIQEAKEPTTLLGRFFQEAGDDDDDEGESLEDIEKDMDGMDDDDSDEKDDDNKDGDEEGEEPELGKDDSDVQNEYDDGDVSSLNELIADEQHAMQAYFKAGKETKNALLARLYNDIGAEEAFHSEQLLYAKAELTGEKYEPSDPEVKKEYEELLENGMDEETAMYTVADKHKLEIDIDDGEDLEDIEKDIENLEESFTMTTAGLELAMAIQESAAYKTNNDLRRAYCEFFQCAQDTMFMEAMDNVATKQGQEILGTNNPFIIVGRMIKNVYIAIINLVKKIKNWVNKRRIKSKRAMAWLKKNGIKGLFAKGVKLYCWNGETGTVEVSDSIAYMRLCMGVTDWVAKAVGVPTARVTEPDKASGIAFNNFKTSGKAITFTSISDGARKIDGVVFSKSKIVVTDQNQADLEQMFFGYSNEKFVKNDTDGSKYSSMNIYNALQYILEWAGNQLKATDEWLEKTMIPAAGRQKGIAYSKPEVYRECIDAMKSVAKGYNRLIKCITSDISACMKLDQGLLNAVNKVDEDGVFSGENIPKDSEARDSEGNVRYTDKLQ